MNQQRFSTIVFSIIVLAGILASGQQFPGQGDDMTSSLGSFKVQIMPQFVGLFYNPSYPPTAQCPLFHPTTNILDSPSQLLDQGTIIGRSMPVPDGSNATPPFPAGPPSEVGGAPVGSAGTIVNEGMLIPPPGFPCAGLSSCSSGPGTADVLTEVRSLYMTGSGAAVRAGVWYNSPNPPSSPPPAGRISRGKVESQSGPSGTTDHNFPASSFFDVFVQVDIPACGAFPKAFTNATLYNLMPLVVKNNQVTSFPPKVVYLHDSTSIVPIVFLTADTAFNPPRWQKDDILGYFLLVGHGVGYGANDLADFNTTMQGQPNASCPIGPPPPGGMTVQPKSLPGVSTAPSPAAKPASIAGNKSSRGGGN